jgi:hypothetical protein
MSAYKHALLIDDAPETPSLLLAAKALEHCDNVVMLNGIVALRPTSNAILCEVIDPTQDAHRCAEEFKVLIENAERSLAKSKLASLLPNRSLKWLVVSDNGTEAVELWPAS